MSKFSQKFMSKSPFQKRTRTVEKRDDYEAMQRPDGSNPEKDVLVVKNKKGETVREKDISAKRADRIRKRQAKRQARKDVRQAKDPNETDAQIEERVKRDFPEDYGTEGYTGPSISELEARWNITDPKGKKNKPTQAEIDAYKKKHNLP
jgi:hypothetical protein